MKKLLLTLLYLFANTAFADCSLNESEAITKRVDWNNEKLKSDWKLKFINDQSHCRILITFYDNWQRKYEGEYLAINSRVNKAEKLEFNDVKFVDANWETNKTLRTKPLEEEYPNKLILAKDGNLIIWHPSSFFEKSSKWYEAIFLMGLQTGITKIWHANGNLRSESFYLSGELNGTEKVWSENGSLLTEKIYKNGVINSGDEQSLNNNEISTEKYFNKREKELAQEKIKLENERKEQAEKEIKAQQAEELLKKDRIAKAKNKCADLGFALNTDKNAKCVLELMR